MPAPWPRAGPPAHPINPHTQAHARRHTPHHPHLPSPCLQQQVIEDFGLLSFQPLAIEDRDAMRHLVAAIDKSNGFVFAGLAQPGVCVCVCVWGGGG